MQLIGYNSNLSRLSAVNRLTILQVYATLYFSVRLKPTIDKIIPRGLGLWGIFFFSPS